MLLDIDDLSKDKILSLIKEAILIKNNNAKIINKKSIVNIFIEPSTRTKISFQKAQKDLQMDVYNLDFETSSLDKNEDLSDTIYTLKQYGINNFVIRSNEEEYWKKINIKDIKIINAGDGKNNHPTQALIDAMTIYESFNTLDNLKILICGDTKNSRVFHSFKKLIQKFSNCKLLISTPDKLKEKNIEYVDFNNNLPNVDVVMMLRIQSERHTEKFDSNKYNEKFGINKNNIIKLQKNAILLHPGPINRGVEIDNDIGYENPQIKILDQVKNGLYIRKLLLGKL